MVYKKVGLHRPKKKENWGLKRSIRKKDPNCKSQNSTVKSSFLSPKFELLSIFEEFLLKIAIFELQNQKSENPRKCIPADSKDTIIY